MDQILLLKNEMGIVNKGRLTPIFQNLKLKFKNNFRYFNPFRYNSYKRLVVKKKKKTQTFYCWGGGAVHFVFTRIKKNIWPKYGLR